MIRYYLPPVISIFTLSIVISCSTQKKIAATPATSAATGVMKEFRAAWIATVANINWPSKPGLSTEEQKKEAVELLDFLQNHNFNAAILQVRPQCDALYKSELEPWSYYLTGKQGQAPSPYYDPLEFWVEEAHNRGIELHVWLNPYRAHHKDGKEITEHSIVKKRPELALYLKEGYWWLDPAQKGTQDHSTAVVMDLVNRYDIDGVHFDDYFYPYPSYNLGADFPDSASWNAYQQAGGKLSRGDWRREAVNVFIENLYSKIKATKPYVKFGLSPFGIWRPGYPESVEGFDQYEQLYADAKLWLNKGWIDYFTPQLYWPINRQAQSFPVLLGWWSGENIMKRHLWPGMSVGRDTSVRSVNETLNQIMITRGMVPESKGAVHWSISSVTKNPTLAKALLESTYKKQALVPASPWLDNKAPAAPTITTNQSDKISISWNHPDEKDVFKWVVYYKYGNNWNYIILNRNDRSYSLNNSIEINKTTQVLKQIAVTAIDRTGNESVRKEITVQ
ncbi:MAG TPA: family 10 glycosylhydrolase [Chitinophagaceae bacterium]|nr:family 10 glycosylhydrolase [Chitinophagaceae bacterium]